MVISTKPSHAYLKETIAYWLIGQIFMKFDSTTVILSPVNVQVEIQLIYLVLYTRALLYCTYYSLQSLYPPRNL